MNDQSKQCSTCNLWEFTDSTEHTGVISHWGVCKMMFRDNRLISGRSNESVRRASTTGGDHGSRCPFHERKAEGQ